MFEDALRFVLQWEGGYVDHPADPGGATNRGITQATYDAWRRQQGLEPRSVREITMDEVRAIYRGYWDAVEGDQHPAPLALALFDLAVNSGVGTARSALRGAGPDWRAIIAWRLTFLTGLSTWGAFGRGWVRRVAALIRECARLDTRVDLGAARRLYVGPYQGAPIERASLVGDKLYVRVKEVKDG